MDHDYEPEDDYAPRILWGRLAFFGLALLLAFVAGRACAPGGVPESQFRAAQEEVTELQSDNQVLQAQLDAAAQQGGQGNAGKKKKKNNNAAAEEEATDGAGEQAVGEGQRYTVQAGDTLTTIAEKFYGDATAFDLIVDANNLDSATSLREGQELVIPPKP